MHRPGDNSKIAPVQPALPLVLCALKAARIQSKFGVVGPFGFRKIGPLSRLRAYCSHAREASQTPPR